MSLAAKLNQMKAEQSESQRASEEKEQQASQQTIIAKINDLEKKKSALELLYNSLQPQADTRAGGAKMPEYAQQVQSAVGRQEAELDRLVNENQEVLAQAGVNNRQDLLDHPEFSSEEEVASYRDSLAQAEDLSVSDEALKKRLSDLGVDLTADSFSYESAAQALAGKIESLDEEIIQEKIKVPEYRQELVDGLAAKISLKELSSLRYEEGANESRLEFAGSTNDKVVLAYDKKNQQAQVDRYASSKWIDDIYGVNWDNNLDQLKAKYGDELVAAGLHQAWRKKIREQIIDSSAKKGGDVRYVKKALEEDLAHRTSAEDKISKLKGVELELNDLLREKASELTQKKQSDRSADLSSLNIFHSKDNNDLLKAISSDNSFPPRYSYQVLDDLAGKKLRVAQDYLEKIRSVQNLEEFKKLVGRQQQDELFKSTVSEDKVNFNWPKETAKYHQETFRLVSDLAKQKEDISQVIKKLDEQINREEKAAAALADKMDVIIDIKGKQSEYLRGYRQAKEELAVSGSFDNVKSYEEMEKRLQENKRDAIYTIQDLQVKERLLNEVSSRRNLEPGDIQVRADSQGNLVVFSQSLNAEQDRFSQSRQKKEDEISDLKKEEKAIDDEVYKLGAKPKLFSGGWEAKQKALQARKDELRRHLEQAQYQRENLAKETSALYEDQRSLSLSKINPYVTQALFKNKEEVFSGQPSEVIKQISDRLTRELVDKASVPENLKRTASEYKKLVDALYSR